MPDIPFTQYLRPNGQKRPVVIDRPQPVYDKAQEILKQGFVFECEETMTGMVSFTISDKDGDYACEVCRNGPKVPETVDKMIIGFDPTRPKQPITG